MAVRQHNGHRLEVVLAHQIGNTRGAVLTRVDNEAFTATAGGHNPTVGSKDASGESSDQHADKAIGSRHFPCDTSGCLDLRPVTSQRRQAELAKAKAARRQARARARRQRTIAGVAVGLVILMVAGLLIGGVFNSTPDPQDSATPQASSDCEAPGTARENNMSYSSFDDTAAQGVSSLTMVTNCGDITFSLDPQAPQTIASIAFLAKAGYFNNTTCHRLTTAGIFVLQCGDPAGDGTGGPGYTIPEENLPAINANGVAVYPRGTVAMARRAEPGSGGSQFFLVYQDSPLPPDYTVFGQITDGIDVLDRVAAAGTNNGSADGLPAQPLFIRSATLNP